MGWKRLNILTSSVHRQQNAYLVKQALFWLLDLNVYGFMQRNSREKKNQLIFPQQLKLTVSNTVSVTILYYIMCNCRPFYDFLQAPEGGGGCNLVEMMLMWTKFAASAPSF